MKIQSQNWKECIVSCTECGEKYRLCAGLRLIYLLPASMILGGLLGIFAFFSPLVIFLILNYFTSKIVEYLNLSPLVGGIMVITCIFLTILVLKHFKFVKTTKYLFAKIVSKLLLWQNCA